MLRQLALPASLLAIALASTITRAAVVINEIDPGQAGLDPFEFVELYAPPNTLLDGHVLVFLNGANDLSYQAFDLDGWQTGPTGHFLLGTAAVVPTPDILFPPISLHNGADAVALYLGDAADFPNGTPATATNLVDAIVYGSGQPIDTGLLTALGESTQYTDTDTTSISRVPDGAGDFSNGTSPSPMSSGLPRTVPEPSSAAMLAALLALSSAFRRRRT